MMLRILLLAVLMVTFNARVLLAEPHECTKKKAEVTKTDSKVFPFVVNNLTDPQYEKLQSWIAETVNRLKKEILEELKHFKCQSPCRATPPHVRYEVGIVREENSENDCPIKELFLNSCRSSECESFCEFSEQARKELLQCVMNETKKVAEEFCPEGCKSSSLLSIPLIRFSADRSSCNFNSCKVVLETGAAQIQCQPDEGSGGTKVTITVIGERLCQEIPGTHGTTSPGPNWGVDLDQR